jgi:hypothetical protein
MPAQDTSELKNRIIQTIQNRGPSLPIHISSATGQSMLFSSAFLSELLAEKRLKLSNMRVGSSPLYLIPGQEPKLENFSHHLKSKEREAYEIIKSKNFLLDAEQHPAIRVALRSIKDFAIPFQHNNQIYWRYFTTPMEEFKAQEEIRQPTQQPVGQEQTQQIKQEEIERKQNQGIHQTQILQKEPQKIIEQPQREENTPNIKDNNESENENTSIKNTQNKENLNKVRVEIKQTPKPKKPIKKTSKQDDKFFNNVKDYLNQKNIEILGIEGITKSELSLKIRRDNKDKILIAFNKKRISESDILKAFKKSQELNLPYIILSTGEPPRKLSNLVTAIKNLDSIEKIE